MIGAGAVLPVQVGCHFVVVFLFLALQLFLPGFFAAFVVLFEGGQIAFGLLHFLFAAFNLLLGAFQYAILKADGVVQFGHELLLGLQQHGADTLACTRLPAIQRFLGIAAQLGHLLFGLCMFASGLYQSLQGIVAPQRGHFEHGGQAGGFFHGAYRALLPAGRWGLLLPALSPTVCSSCCTQTLNGACSRMSCMANFCMAGNS